jgi:hypothetical protein
MAGPAGAPDGDAKRATAGAAAIAMLNPPARRTRRPTEEEIAILHTF